MATSFQKPCIIYRPAPGWGFWSNFTCVLQGLDHSDLAGYLPVIDMERHRTRYSEDHDEELLGTRNAWEYFFEQPSGMSVAEALTLDAEEYQGETIGTFIFVTDYTTFGVARDRGRELVGRYIRVKPEVQAKVDEFIPPGVHPGILGVHVRGTDMRRGYHTLHPVPAHPQTYLEEAIELDRRNGFAHVFLACDEVETVELFHNHFGSRLMVTTAYRTPVAQGFAEGYDWLFQAKRPCHKYHLGLEVLLDALLLARCGHMLCGCSNVAQAATYFSTKHQVVHFVPPIWRMPLHEMDDSAGREYLASFPPPFSVPSQQALTHQVEELRLILEAVENSRAAALRTAEKDGAEKIAVLQAQLAEAMEALHRTAAESATVKRDAEAARKELSSLVSKHSRLEDRIRHLMDWWTWLGWRFRPWKKPS